MSLPEHQTASGKGRSRGRTRARRENAIEKKSEELEEKRNRKRSDSDNANDESANAANHLMKTDKKDDEQEQKQQEQTEEEQKQAEALLKELQQRIDEKCAMRETNLKVQEHRSDDSEERVRGLDASVKKNSAFVKKLRTMTEQQRDALVREFNSLNLLRYVDEAAQAIGEAKYKMADIGCAVHICSLFHQQYPQFSPALMKELDKLFADGISKEEKPSHLSTYRTALRLIAELSVCGVFDSSTSLTLLQKHLTMIVNGDKGYYNYLTVVMSFARHCGEDLAGLLPRKQKEMLMKHGFEVPMSNLVDTERQAVFRGLLNGYYDSLAEHLQKEHKVLQKIERRNRRAMQTRGEVRQEDEEEAERAQKSYEKLFSNTSTLADVLTLDMPDLPEDVSLQNEESVLVGLFTPKEGESLEEAAANALWEDEDTRTFYQNLIDLKAVIPGILFKEGDGREAQMKSEQKEEQTLDAQDEEQIDDSNQLDGKGEGDEEVEMNAMMKELAVADDDELPPLEGEIIDAITSDQQPKDEATTDMVSTPTPLFSPFDEWLQRLPTCINRQFIDKAATEFCMQLNTKSNRKKLVKALLGVDRNRLDLLPFYSRLVATLNACLPDVGPELVEAVTKQMKWLVHKKDQTNVETKIKVVRFVGELTKFGVCSKSDTIQCLKILIKDLRHHSIDMVSHLLETCGRFLFRSPDSHVRTRVLLEIMMRKMQAMHLDSRYVTMLENAYYECNPPEVQKLVRKVRPPMHEYIRKLLYKDLNKMTVDKVINQFRKLHWDDSSVRDYVIKSLTRVWTVKYSNIRYVADVLSGLAEYKEEVALQVVDALLEDIRVMMEVNLGRFNQRRISAVHYLGELYNYRMVESSVIFRTLYSFLAFGHNSDGSPSHLDPSTSYFRVRLVCVLLDTCGHYFCRGLTKKKLDIFLVYFQCYLWGKEQPMPIEIEFLVHDTVESLRSKLTLFATDKETFEAAAKLEADFRAKLDHIKPIIGDSNPSQAQQEAAARGSISGEDEDEDEEDEENDEDAAGEDEHLGETASDTGDEDEVHFLSGGHKHVPSVEDDSFVAAFDKMMTETIQSRRNETVKVSSVDIPLPMHMRHSTSSTQSFEPADNENSVKTVNFSLVLKKGHKQQFKEIAVPVDSSLIMSIRNKQEAEREEQRQMKRLVLTYEQQLEEEDQKGLNKAPALKPIHQQPVVQGTQQQHPQQKQQRSSGGGSQVRRGTSGQQTGQQHKVYQQFSKKETSGPSAGPRRH
ncbi:regulator of nonsense transcripts 2-like [Corticium candelabrum]|uniref:regulator of nonsense transcripts 2-like n=1 Tax=Corticium candelabrum TaxID=121492 RepID=UPI002E264236|nr:regulator of nonsense transcripts 2-like [Corticium candelabrum]